MGRPVETVLMPCHSSVIQTGRGQLQTPTGGDVPCTLHSQTGSATTLLPQQEEDFPPAQQQSQPTETPQFSQ